jgi:hypothetical protein
VAPKKVIDMPDECWKGNAPHHRGSPWCGKDLAFVTSDVYLCWFGSAETITVNGKETLVKADFNVGNAENGSKSIFFYGWNDPVIWVTNNLGVKYDSTSDSPKVIAKQINDKRFSKIYKTKVGKLFLERCPDALNYTFEYSDKEERHE